MEMLHQKCKKYIVVFLAVMLGLSVLSKFLDTIIIPQVTLETPKMGVLQFQVKGSGILEAAQIQTVPVLPELNVRNIAASPGQSVTPDTPLFAYQLDELKALHEKQERELQQLNLSLAAEKLAAQPLPEMSAETLALQELAKTETQLARNQEKLAKTEAEYQTQVTALNEEHTVNLEKNKADLADQRKKNYEQAKRTYETARLNQRLETESTGWAYDSAVLRLEQQQDEGAAFAELEQAVLEVDKARHNQDIMAEKWQAEVAAAKQEMDEAYDDWQALLDGTEDVEAKLKKELDQNIRQEQAKLDLAREQLTSSADAYQDARTALENARTNDANARTGSERELALSAFKQQSLALDVEAKEQEVEKLAALIARDGIVYAPYPGILTKIEFTAGSRLVQIGSGDLIMKAKVDAKQAKNLSANHSVSLKKENRMVDGQAVLQSLAFDPEKNQADLTAALTGTGLLPGASVDFVCESKSAPYDLTIPLDALRQDNQGTFVLLAQERSTILGTELKAVRLGVTVLAQSPDRAAIEGSISTQDRLITGSTKQIEEGSRVRVVSE